MRSLLLVAHGSRREASNDEIRVLIARMRAVADGFDHLACAFLEIAEPSIAEGLHRAIASGAAEVVVLPYFLSAGRHVVEDIPAAIAPVQTQYPGVDIRLVPHLGSADGIVRLLLELASRSTDSPPAGGGP